MSKNLSKFSNEQAASSDQGDESERSLSGIKLLLVDDSSDNRTLLSYMLSSLGAEVEGVDNGNLAVQLANAGEFDAVLMDLRMPGLSGDQAAISMRKNGFIGPIVAMTAHLGRVEQELCAASGVTQCLERPISRSALTEVILNSIKKVKTIAPRD